MTTDAHTHICTRCKREFPCPPKLFSVACPTICGSCADDWHDDMPDDPETYRNFRAEEMP